MTFWHSIDNALIGEEKAEWNKWRQELWEKAQDLEVATHQCPIGDGLRGEKISDLSSGLRSTIGDVPIFETDNVPEAEGCLIHHNEKEKKS